MTLRQLRDRLSLSQIGIAVLAVALGGGVQWWSVGLLVAFVVWAFVRPTRPDPSRRSVRIWTAIILVALVATAVRVVVWADFLDAGVDFLLLLVAQRLFNRQRAREHLQLLMLGLLLMVVAAVVNTGLNYPILFAAYLLAAVTTLLVNHLMSEGERLGPRVGIEVAKAGVRSRHTLFRSAASVTAMAALGGLLVFLLFPRWGMGVFLRGAMARDVQSGFSGDVQLGGFGRIKTDTTVVARIRPVTETEPVPQLHWHFRGSSLDHYEAGRWTHGRQAERTPLHAIGVYDVLAPGGEPQLEIVSQLGRLRTYAPTKIEGFQNSTEQLRGQVILEDLGVDVLFLASDPVAVRVTPRGPLERKIRLRGGLNQEVHLDKPPGPTQYEFISRAAAPMPEELRAIGDPAVDRALRPYLQRSSELSTDLTELARRLTQDEPTRYDKVMAVMAHLSSFDYSLDLRTPPSVEQGADPVEGFLFETQAGHCEYFATALAVTLREVGIPTRIVNGYYGAHYNELGNFYAVRQADAHSWVEVHFGPIGWVTFDPTPPSGRAAGADVAMFPGLSQALDALRNAYLEYVIDYNLTKQMALLENLGVSRQGPSRRIRVAWKTVATWLAPVLAGIVIVALLRRRKRRTHSPEAAIYAALVNRLGNLGHPRQPHESPRRFASRLRADGAPGASAFAEFARRYERVRFGQEATEADLPTLRKLARDVLRQLR